MKKHILIVAMIGLSLLSSFTVIPTFGFNTTNLSKKITNHFINNEYSSFFPSQSDIASNVTYEYVIITNRYLESSNFQLLIDHKSQYINATIVTKEDILGNSSFWVDGTYGDATNASNGNPWIEDDKEVSVNFSRFNDTAAKIRNFIRFAHQQWGTEYVLLGGDIEIIPVRMLRINEAYWYNGLYYKRTSADIPSDLYYAALHGTWNNDFDQYFGEDQDHSTGEEADFIAEVYVGRAPVDDREDVTTFVNKIIHFETTTKPNHIQLHQSGMNIFNFPDSTKVPEACAKCIPDNYYEIHKLYQVNEKITLKKWIDCFREPEKLIVLHVGCGGKRVYILDQHIINRVRFSISDVNKLDNTFFPIHISIACDSGDFESRVDCLAEKLLLYSDGGPSACLFNSFHGFATRWDAHKYSGELIEQQFNEIFQKGTENLGKINQFAKEHFINNASLDPGYRWCYYTVNLLGDPETSIFETR